MKCSSIQYTTGLMLVMVIMMIHSIHHYHYLSRSINASVTYDEIPVDISWIDYLNEVYGIKTVDSNFSSDSIRRNPFYDVRRATMYSTNPLHFYNQLHDNSSAISKHLINFYYRNSHTRIQPLDWPMNQLFLHQRTKSDHRNHYRVGYKSKETFEDHTWVEVNRFSSNFLNRYSVTRSSTDWIEGYSNGLTGNISIFVPYGCWFMSARGSGIFINIGRSLRIKGDWSKDIKYSFGSMFDQINKLNGCIINDTSHNCHDKYYCSIALSYGYDSIQTYGNNEIVICSHNCSVMPVTGTCPPLEMRTGYDASNACTCSDDNPILNCRETIISKRHDMTTNHIIAKHMNITTTNINNSSNNFTITAITPATIINGSKHHPNIDQASTYRPYSCISCHKPSSTSLSSSLSSSPLTSSLHATIVYRSHDSISNNNNKKQQHKQDDTWSFEHLQRLADDVKEQLDSIAMTKMATLIPSDMMNIILIDKKHDVILSTSNTIHTHSTYDENHHNDGMIHLPHHTTIKHTIYITILTRIKTASFHHIDFNPSIGNGDVVDVLDVMSHHSIGNNDIPLQFMTPMKINLHTRTSSAYNRFASMLVKVASLDSKVVVNIGVIIYNTKYEHLLSFDKNMKQSGNNIYDGDNVGENNHSIHAHSSGGDTTSDVLLDDEEEDDKMMLIVRHLIDESNCLRVAGAHFVVLVAEIHPTIIRHNDHSDSRDRRENGNIMNYIMRHTQSYIDVILSSGVSSRLSSIVSPSLPNLCEQQEYMKNNSTIHYVFDDKLCSNNNGSIVVKMTRVDDDVDVLIFKKSH